MRRAFAPDLAVVGQTACPCPGPIPAAPSWRPWVGSGLPPSAAPSGSRTNRAADLEAAVEEHERRSPPRRRRRGSPGSSVRRFPPRCGRSADDGRDPGTRRPGQGSPCAPVRHDDAPGRPRSHRTKRSNRSCATTTPRTRSPRNSRRSLDGVVIGLGHRQA